MYVCVKGLEQRRFLSLLTHVISMSVALSGLEHFRMMPMFRSWYPPVGIDPFRGKMTSLSSISLRGVSSFADLTTEWYSGDASCDLRSGLP